MRLLRLMRRHPLALLGLFAVAFICWIWWDALPVRAPVPAPGGAGVTEAPGPLRRFLPSTTDDSAKADAPNGLSKLKPGMMRAEVERLVGAPAAEHVYPVQVTDGRATYHAAYEADLGPPPTIRPIRSHRSTFVREPDVMGRTLVMLEFDATKPGHPLLGVHFPDPLF